MKTMKWVNTLAFLAMVTINMLSNLLPLGGKTTGQISDAYPSLFTPAGMTFSIWGVIYVLLGVFILYQWGLLDTAEESRRVSSAIGILFAVSCVLNILWILCWHSDAIGWSLLCMAGLLISLILIQRRLRSDPPGLLRRIAVHAGFDIYFGWIIAASIANISVWLVRSGWDRFSLSETFWTTAVLIIGAAIGICVVLIGRNRLAGWALIWAYIGILTKHLSGSGFAGRYPIIIIAAGLGIAGILASTVIASSCTALQLPEVRDAVSGQ